MIVPIPLVLVIVIVIVVPIEVSCVRVLLISPGHLLHPAVSAQLSRFTEITA